MEILTDKNFKEKINIKDRFVLVDFFATWCEPCNILGGILEKVAEKFKDKVIFMKVNVDEAPTTSQKFKIESIPRVILFKNGKPINDFVGAVPEKSITDWLNNIIK